MKKLYQKLLTLSILSLLFFSAGDVMGQVFITELADPNNDAGSRYIELYNSGSTTVDFTEGSGWRIDKYTNANATVSQTLSLTGTIAPGSFYIIATGASDADFATVYGVTPDQFDGSDNNVAGSNGDDNLELYDGAGALVDQFGVPGEDGTGTTHEFEDGRAERKKWVTSGNATWNVNEWIVDNDSGGGDGPIDAPAGFDPASWIGPDLTASTFLNSTPSAANVGEIDFDLVTELDEEATVYYVVLSDGSAAPSASEVRAGTGNAGSAAVLEGNFVVDGNTSTNTTIAGLTASTAYDVYVMAEDFASFQTAVQAVVEFTTTANVAPTITSIATPIATVTSEIVLTMSEIVNVTDASGFSVTIGGVNATVSSIAGDGSSELTLTVAETISKTSGDVFVSYDGTGNVTDGTFGLAAIADIAVTNNTTATIVANIAEARALAGGEDVVITGEVFVSYVTANSRNQIFVQDASAGILIDDSAPVIAPGTFSQGDGIINFEGTLGGFGGVTQIVPLSVPAVNSSANVLTPIVVTIADFNAALDTYESRLLKFENVTFPTADGTLDFGTPTSDYSEVSNGVETTTLDADGFLGVDYSTTVIPYGRRDLIALGRENNGTPIITPRSSADIIDVYAPVTDEAAAVANITTGSFDVTIGFDEPASVKYIVNTNATATQGDVLASADMVTQNDPSLTATINLTALADNTQYYVHMVAMDASGDNPQAAVTTVDATTLEIVFDATTTITAADAPVAQATITAVAAAAEADSVAVFKFKVTDDGAADAEPTKITSLVIENANATTWSSVLAGAVLTDGVTSTTVTSITDTELGFDFATPIEVANASSTTYTLLVWFNTAQTDGTTLAFSIPTAHSFIADASGSAFETTLAAEVASATHTIDVVATELAITGAPTTVQTAEAFGFTVTAQDANGNVDTAARQLTASTAASGVLGGTLAGPMTAGVYTYADLTYDTEGAFTVSVTDGALTATTDITATAVSTGTLFFSEYIEGNSNNRAIEIYNGTGADVDLGNYTVKQSHNGVGFDNDAVADAYALPLSGTLVAGDVYIIYNDGASLPDILAEGDLALTYGDTGGARMASFTGDDALGLFEGATLIDLFGDPAVDPGSAWDVAGVAGATANKTLVRKASITEGNIVALGSFGTNATDSEWIVYDVDVTTYLGFFGELTDPTITATTANFIGDFGYVANPASSEASSYTVSAVNLTTDLVVTAPAGFELSLTSDFASPSATLNLVPTTGTVAETEIFVRFTPTAADGATYGGDITHVAAGAPSINLAVSGIEGELALSTIAEARTLTAGDLVKVQGTVTTPDYGFSNGQYYIQDETGGINIFHFGNQGLVNSGDIVEIEGNIAIFNDLVEIEPTMVTVLSTGNTLPEATAITEAGLTLDEATQGTRVVIEGVSLVDQSIWPVDAIAAGSSLDVAAIAGATNFIINIDRGESFYDGSPVPPTSFTITGILTRAGSDVLILPFYDGEIVETVFDPVLTVTGTANGFDFGTVEAGLVSTAQSFTVAGTNLTADVVVTAPAGYEVSESETGTYSSAITAFVDQAGEVTETTVFVRFAPSISVTGVVNGDLTITTGELSQSVALTATATAPIPTANKSALAGVKAYPNPTNDILFVDFAENKQSFNYQVFSLSGAVLVRGKATNGVEIKLADLQSGIYMLEVTQGDKVFRARIAKH